MERRGLVGLGHRGRQLRHLQVGQVHKTFIFNILDK